MTPNSAYSLIDIVVGVDYTPGPINETIGTAIIEKGRQPPIYGLLCTKGGTAGNIELKLLGMTDPISIPAATFKQGVIYYFYLKELVSDNGGDVKFVGVKYNNFPLVF